MIVDIEKIAEDKENACYKAVRADVPVNLFLVSKVDMTVLPIIVGDIQAMAGASAKLRRVVNAGDLPARLALATG